ncbi:Reticulon-4-interacting protein 1-like 2 [Homarus americanus]|uniref:Reticulon-4-interacting protein 1-like 2 n=1 Tax=Homarus americanus TaxID=6706 RepID=A0A8J5JTK3_HOMAM|nr:Reticulon-4-interacting protein 1-like 2 [Homarus americanus]
MDHLIFLAQERVESLQLTLRSASSRLANNVTSLGSGARTTFTNTVNAIKNQRLRIDLTDKVREWLAKLREALSAFYPSQAIGVVEDVVAPRIIEPYQVLIQVKAAGIDYLDIKVAEGYGRVMRKQLNKYNPNTDGEFPVVLGRDCSGIVVAIGKAVTRVEQGEEVWLAVPFYHPGTLSEYVVVSEKLVALKPTQLSYEGAAALPYSIMTAWDALVTQGGLGPDSTTGKRYDVILNTVGQVLHDSCLKHCLPGGVVVTTTSSQLASDSFGYVTGGLYSLYMRARYWFTKSPWLTGGRWGTSEVSGNVLEKVSPLVDSGRLQAVVDKVYTAQDAEGKTISFSNGRLSVTLMDSPLW